MKFFTVEWYKGDDCEDDRSEPAFLERARAYESRLDELARLLPQRLMELARLPGVDDGWVVEVHHVRSQQRLLLILRCGFNDIGYYDLLLTYEEAEISAEHEWVLARLARAQLARSPDDLYLHEVDIEDDGRIAHRMLFHPGVWFGIRCRELRWETVNRADWWSLPHLPDRSLPPVPDRFPCGPTAPPQRLRRRRLRREASQA